MMTKKQTKVIAVLNQKGGVGKTTLVTNIGMALSKTGLSVLLVDADPQGSLRDWNDESEGGVLPVIGLDRPTLAVDINAVKDNYDIVIIDGAPQASRLTSAAVKSADLILIPVTPSPYDIWGCADLVDIIKSRQEVTDGKPKAYFVISRARNNTKLGVEIVEALKGYDLNVLEGKTIQREIYMQTASNGETVFHDKDAKKAINEIKWITNEILQVLKNDES